MATTETKITEFPLIKTTLNCPLCNTFKPKGRIACKKCSKLYGLNDESEAMDIIRDREEYLKSTDQLLCGAIHELAYGSAVY